MARHSRSPSVGSSLTGQTTLDSEGTERLNQVALELEDGEISEDAKSIVQASPDNTAPPQLSTITGSPSPSDQEHMPLDATQGDASLEPPPRTGRSPLETPGTSPMEPITPRALSDEEVDYAKSIVLDLLGWGVEPEYLIECGVSSHAIYRIFTDLHLRLPSNLALG